MQYYLWHGMNSINLKWLMQVIVSRIPELWEFGTTYCYVLVALVNSGADMIDWSKSTGIESDVDTQSILWFH